VNNDLLEYYKNTYFSSELPIPFHLKDEHLIYINPIKVRDYPIYSSSIGLLMIDKNKISDVKIINMSYLRFLHELVESDKDNMQMLLNVLILSLGEQYNYFINIDEKDKAKLILKRKKDGKKITVTSKEFDQIKSIILYYNDEDYDDRYISDDLQKAMENYYKAKSKNQYNPTLEDKKCYMISKNGMTMQQINEMTYRTFNKAFNYALGSELYLSRKILQASEKYKVDDVNHPLFEKHSKFDFLQDAKQFEETVASAGKV
jgi:hypothetical protein